EAAMVSRFDLRYAGHGEAAAPAQNGRITSTARPRANGYRGLERNLRLVIGVDLPLGGVRRDGAIRERHADGDRVHPPRGQAARQRGETERDAAQEPCAEDATGRERRRDVGAVDERLTTDDGEPLSLEDQPEVEVLGREEDPRSRGDPESGNRRPPDLVGR